MSPTLLLIALAVAVSVLGDYASQRGQSWGDWLATALFASYAVYCVQHFIRCREVHCAITAPGFVVATVLMLLRVMGLGLYDYSLPWIVFAASACIGACAQWAYKARTGSAFFGSR